MENTVTGSSELIHKFHHANPREFESGQQFEKFLRAYPEYANTLALSEFRAQQFPYLNAYLDWTGAGQPAASLLSAHTDMLMGHTYGNPHSESRDSLRATGEVERARAAVLDYFGASADEYTVIFTPNASGALRLVGESYLFGPQHSYLHLRDNHNSVLGIRTYARHRGAAVGIADISPDSLRTDEADLESRLKSLPKGLFAYPAQSNFSGVQHSLDWIDRAQELDWDVLLDAAAFVPSNRLDLSLYKPQFVALSFYKMFGYPTGIGCLLVRHDALEKLERPWFAGGTVDSSSSVGGWHILSHGPAGFEDGTVDFLGIPAVSLGLAQMETMDIQRIHDRCLALTGWLLEQMQELRHTNGRPLMEVYGPTDTKERGATIAFNFLDPDGHVVDERIVSPAANKCDVSLRAGCFCNPGAAEVTFDLSKDKLSQMGDPASAPPMTMDERLGFLGLESGGAIRVSLGNVSTFNDVEQFLAFAASFIDAEQHKDDLVPRNHC